MKQKILTKGNIALFLLTFAMTVLAGFVTAAFTADRVNIIAVSAMGGIGALFAFGAYLDFADKDYTSGPEAGVIGTVLGVISMLIVF